MVCGEYWGPEHPCPGLWGVNSKLRGPLVALSPPLSTHLAQQNCHSETCHCPYPHLQNFCFCLREKVDFKTDSSYSLLKATELTSFARPWRKSSLEEHWKNSEVVKKICMQVRRQQWELDTEQKTGSKYGKDYVKAVYCHSAYLTYMQSTSWEMLGWKKHKLESRLPEEISITSDVQMTPPLWQKVKKN